jgi:hypothetical protein
VKKCKRSTSVEYSPRLATKAVRQFTEASPEYQYTMRLYHRFQDKHDGQHRTLSEAYQFYLLPQQAGRYDLCAHLHRSGKNLFGRSNAIGSRFAWNRFMTTSLSLIVRIPAWKHVECRLETYRAAGNDMSHIFGTIKCLSGKSKTDWSEHAEALLRFSAVSDGSRYDSEI